jgi:hypothetical protein
VQVFDEANPSVLSSKIYDTWGHVTLGRLISMEGNGKNVILADYGYNTVHEGQEITFDTTGAGSVSTEHFDRTDCCFKTGWQWRVCTEVWGIKPILYSATFIPFPTSASVVAFLRLYIS